MIQRRREKSARADRLCLRLNEYERSALRRLARDAECSMAAMAIRLIEREAKRLGVEKG